MTVASNVKGTLASLKGAAGTLRIYALQTNSSEAQSIFEAALKDTNEVIADLERRVKVLEFEEPQYKGK